MTDNAASAAAGCDASVLSAATAGPGGAATRRQAGELLLSVRCDATRWGDVVAVAGEGPALRQWGQQPAGPLRLSCVDPASGDSVWPLWTLEEPIPVAEGDEIEYKYLIVRDGAATGELPNRCRWETRLPGENRRLRISLEVLRAGRHVDDEFGQLRPCTPGEGTAWEAERRRRGDVAISETERRRGDDAETATATRSGAGSQSAGPAMPPLRRLRRVGKGKQGRCFLVELDSGGMAVLKELSGGGRHAFRAEVASLSRLAGTSAGKAGCVPCLLGVREEGRQVLMSYFNGAALPDMELAPVLRSGDGRRLALALQSWRAVASAAEEANAAGIIHCDLNPWNVLVATGGFTDEPPTSARDAGAEPAACLVDWACAREPSEGARGLPFKRRGDFQPEELLAGRVGPRTDVFGAAATLLWLLVRRTRKGLDDRSEAGLTAYFALEVESAGYFLGSSYSASTKSVDAGVLAALARACSWGLCEAWGDRCESLGPLREVVEAALQRLDCAAVEPSCCPMSTAGQGHTDKHAQPL